MKKFLALAALLILAACAPSEQAFHPAAHAPAIEQDYFLAADGARLPLRQWMTKKKPKAIAIALHGFNDYSNAFTDTAEYFKRRGIATYAYDQRGFGASADTGIWANEKNLTRDLVSITEEVARRHPNIPIFLMGESMGGAVVIIASATHDLPVRGVVLQAPAVWGEKHMPWFYSAVLNASAYTLPWYKLTGEDLDIIASNNIEMLRALGRDPLVIKATRIDAIYGLTNMMAEAYDMADDIPQPGLLLYGYEDQVIPRQPIEEISEYFRKAPSETIFYDEGYHMLTRDLQGEEVMKDIADWMLALSQNKKAAR